MRIFIGIPLTEKTRNAVRSEVEKIKPLIHKGRFSSWEGYHITLAFLGEVSEVRMEELAMKLECARLETMPFEIEFTTLGAFQKSKGDVLWLGVTASEHLLTLKQEVEAIITSAGFVPEERAYVAHLTLGRGVRYTQSFEKMQRQWSFKRHPVWVDRIVLFESVQVEGQLCYVPLLYKTLG